jgi:hypothetical protein
MFDTGNEMVALSPTLLCRPARWLAASVVNKSTQRAAGHIMVRMEVVNPRQLRRSLSEVQWSMAEEEWEVVIALEGRGVLSF